MEEHIVITRDDYILGIHRIPEGKYSTCNNNSGTNNSNYNIYTNGHRDNDDDNRSRIESIFEKCGISHSAIRYTSHQSKGHQSATTVKPVVMLYHGLMMCSEVWMCNLEAERRLACMLADAG